MYTFSITYDRHKDRYTYRTQDFPADYGVNESALNYSMDPDWYYKLRVRRINLKRWILLFGLTYWWVKNRVVTVEEFDRIKRIEQRAMQNTEIEDLYNKKVTFILYDSNGKEFTENDLVKSGNEYYVFWYDAKMKNYLLFIEHLHKRKFIQAKVCPVLVVDKPQYMQNIEKIRNESKDEKMKGDVQVMLKRDLSDQESLLRTFATDEDEDVVDLDLKKNFFYVVNPEGKIIDCAKIYSFLHEDNIFKRITAKISKDIDDRINKPS